MFKIKLNVCEYKPYLQPSMPQLLKSTENAIQYLFNDLMVVKNYSMVDLCNKFDYIDSICYNAMLINNIANPLPSNSTLFARVTPVKCRYEFLIQLWLAIDDINFVLLNLTYSVVPDLSDIVTLNDINW